MFGYYVVDVNTHLDWLVAAPIVSPVRYTKVAVWFIPIVLLATPNTNRFEAEDAVSSWENVTLALVVLAITIRRPEAPFANPFISIPPSPVSLNKDSDPKL